MTDEQPMTALDHLPLSEEPDGDEWSESSAGPVYANAGEWAHDWLIPAFVRDKPQSSAWCAEWWEHPEAAIRIYECWRGWESARREDGSSMSGWIVYHLDHHLDQLRDPGGPFKGCTPDQHRPDNNHRPVRVADLPAGLADFLT